MNICGQGIQFCELRGEGCSCCISSNYAFCNKYVSQINVVLFISRSATLYTGGGVNSNVFFSYPEYIVDAPYDRYIVGIRFSFNRSQERPSYEEPFEFDGG